MFGTLVLKKVSRCVFMLCGGLGAFPHWIDLHFKVHFVHSVSQGNKQIVIVFTGNSS